MSMPLKESVKVRLFAWLSALAFVAFLLPNHYSPWLSVHQEWAMAIAILPLSLWAVCSRRADIPVLALAAWLIALVPLIQLGFGQIVFSGDAIMASLYLSGFGFAVLTGARYVGRPGQAPALADLAALWVALVLAGVVSMGIAVHQWLDLKLLGVLLVEMPPRSRVFANLAQPNHFATFLLMGITGLIFLYESGKVRAPVALMTCLIFVFGLVMTGSRSAMLAVLGFWVLYLIPGRRCKLRTTWTAAIGVTAFYALMVFVWPDINQLLLLDESDGDLANPLRLAAGVRVVYWNSMLDAIHRAPWAGYGWGQISFAQQAVALSYPATLTFFESSHNLLIDLMLWNGLPVGLAFIGVVGTWLVWQFRTVNDALSWCLLLATGFVLNHAMLEYPLSYAYFLLPAGLWMGALSARENRWPLVVRLPAGGRVVPVITALIATVTASVFAAVSWEYPTFEDDWRTMRFEEQRIGEHANYVPPQAVLLTQLGELLKFIRTKATPGMSQQQLQWMRSVSMRYGYSSALYSYAVAAGLNNQAADATNALRLLCSMHPSATCKDARESWQEMSRSRWPQLAKIPFPSTADPR